jgi:hypothetical protein
MLDLRLPVGIFFTIVGAVLMIDGLVHPIHTPGVSFILNRDWGFCLLVFGLLMGWFGYRAQKAANVSADQAAAPLNRQTDASSMPRHPGQPGHPSGA